MGSSLFCRDHCCDTLDQTIDQAVAPKEVSRICFRESPQSLVGVAGFAELATWFCLPYFERDGLSGVGLQIGHNLIECLLIAHPAGIHEVKHILLLPPARQELSPLSTRLPNEQEVTLVHASDLQLFLHCT